jgi:hypothetical protein
MDVREVTGDVATSQAECIPDIGPARLMMSVLLVTWGSWLNLSEETADFAELLWWLGGVLLMPRSVALSHVKLKMPRFELFKFIGILCIFVALFAALILVQRVTEPYPQFSRMVWSCIFTAAHLVAAVHLWRHRFPESQASKANAESLSVLTRAPD